jgi:hypothetical protein
MKKLIFFTQRMVNLLKSLGKDVFVLFLSVLLAFSVDRMYENYQEKDKLHTALRNFYVETKQDISGVKANTYCNFDSSVAIINRHLTDNDISLMELDDKYNLARFSLFSISLAYIEKNPNLVLDTEMQYNISKMANNYQELSFHVDKLKEIRLSNAFIEKGVNAQNSKLVMINILKEIRRYLVHSERDFKEFEDLLLKRKIIKL